MLFKSIKLNRFLSFSDTAEAVDLRRLNLIIGPNGCGKSNFLEAFALIRRVATDDDLRLPVDAIYKSDGDFDSAAVEVEVVHAVNSVLRHRVSINHYQADEYAPPRETIDKLFRHFRPPQPPSPRCKSLYSFPAPGRKSGSMILEGSQWRALSADEQRAEASILGQLRDPDRFPEIAFLADRYRSIRLFRDWRFGPSSPLRNVQSADRQNRFLEEDGSNLGLVLNRFQRLPKVKDRFLDALRKLYQGITDYAVYIQPGTVQVEMREAERMIPAARLSDGTVRYLCLLAILLEPDPPPLVCIEEPELGMHPDILPTLAELLLEASERCQLVVTTHSDVLVDAMHDAPENVLVAEKDEQGTHLRRLSEKQLKPWLEQYRLGQLWMNGDIGGTRW